MVEKQRNGYAPELVMPQEPDDGIFDGNTVNTARLNMAEITGFELLKRAEEITLGQEIFVGKLALRNLQSILDIIPSQHRLKVEQVLSIKRSKRMLSVLEKEIEDKPAGIKKREKEGENADTDKAFLKDVRENDALLKDIVDKFDIMTREGDEKAAEEIISDFVQRQLLSVKKD